MKPKKMKVGLTKLVGVRMAVVDFKKIKALTPDVQWFIRGLIYDYFDEKGSGWSSREHAKTLKGIKK